MHTLLKVQCFMLESILPPKKWRVESKYQPKLTRLPILWLIDAPDNSGCKIEAHAYVQIRMYALVQICYVVVSPKILGLI